MAKVDGPLFSFGASGSIADTMTFAKWKGRPYVRQHVIPSNPKSAAQVGGRVMWKFLTQQWAGMSTSDKNTWIERASAAAYSTFNAYMSYNMDRWTESLPVTQPYPAAGESNDELPTAATISGTGTERSLSLTMPNGGTNWGVILYGADGEAPTGLKSQAIAVVATVPDATTVYPIQNVPVDYDTFAVRAFSVDGDQSVVTALPIGA